MNGIYYIFARIKYKKSNKQDLSKPNSQKKRLLSKKIFKHSAINIITTEKPKIYFRIFNISAEEIILDVIELCKEIFEYRDIFIHKTKILMSKKIISVIFVEKKVSLKVTNYKGQYFTYFNLEKEFKLKDNTQK
jgi:hypothetical protein